jgi:eukaryotic-like serine/threonine-protein kinase
VEDSDRFGPYVVYECLGTGGMATVHRAEIELEDDATREVALKRLLPQFATDKRFVDDLIREGKLAAQLQHPNIVRVLELGRIGRTYFIAMDLVRGQPLMAVMRRAHQKRVRPPIGIVLSLMTEMLDALDHAHAAQIVHRDLTPSNLIVTDEGHLQIIDFGVAKALVGALQTSSGLAKGKLGYMSMEAIGGRHVDMRADIFSAGVVMWELVAMRRLFRGETDLELIQAIRTQVPEPPSRYNPECPAALDDVILRALARSRDDRWSSAGEMTELLGELRHSYPASAEDVLAWLHQLRADTVPAFGRPEVDNESTVVRLSTRDLFDHGDHAHELAAGSDAATYDELLDDPHGEPSIEIIEPVQPSARGSARFKDADTVVSVSAHLQRDKRR